MHLSIIIVNYKTYEYTKNTILSVLSSKMDFEYDIILVDNASFDGSLEKLEDDFADHINKKKIKIIRNDTNRGFSAANNLGLKSSDSEYFLLLNSDTKVFENTIANCLDFMKNQDKEMLLTCKILLENGELDHACKRGFPTPSASLHYFLGMDKINPIKYGQYNYLMLDENESGYVDVISGAFMMFSKRVIDKIGYLDEDYFMYGEDIDFCFKAKQNGIGVFYYPEEKIIHYKSISAKKRKFKTLFDFHNAMWIFYKKNYMNDYNIFVGILVFLGIWLKFGLSLLLNLFKR